MKALVCPEIGGEDALRVDDVPARACGPDEIRIAVHAGAVNFPDTLLIRGQYQERKEPPFVPGFECAGAVSEVGARVEGFAVGDRVMAMTMDAGGFAEELVCAATESRRGNLHRIPDGMPYDEAAGFAMTYGTGLHAWQRARLQPGERVLVLGAAGGCGSAAIQVAKAMGAWVIGAASSPEKLALAEQCGADAVVDYQAESLSQRVKELTDGAGVDVVFDPVGGADFREYLRTLAWNGRYLVVGFAGGDIPTLALNLVLLKSVSMIGVAYGASVERDPSLTTSLFARLFEWYAEGKLRTAIGQRFPLADAADALRVVRDRGALGKVVVDVA